MWLWVCLAAGVVVAVAVVVLACLFEHVMLFSGRRVWCEFYCGPQPAELLPAGLAWLSSICLFVSAATGCPQAWVVVVNTAVWLVLTYELTVGAGHLGGLIPAVVAVVASLASVGIAGGGGCVPAWLAGLSGAGWGISAVMSGCLLFGTYGSPLLSDESGSGGVPHRASRSDREATGSSGS